MKADKRTILLVMLVIMLAACAPQAAEEGELPTLVVLPSLEPTLEPTLAPPTAAVTETPPPSTAPEVTATPETTLEVVQAMEPNPGDGNMLPGCDTWQTWDAARLDLRDRIYAQPPAADPAATALTQVEQLRAEVALLDYDECLAEARNAYLSALTAAALALSAPDRATAESFETSAAEALTQFDNAIRVLENS